MTLIPKMQSVLFIFLTSFAFSPTRSNIYDEYGGEVEPLGSDASAELVDYADVVHPANINISDGFQVPSGNLVPLRKISGTNLYTGVYYQLGMKVFPEGWVTWTQTETKAKDGNYIQINFDPEQVPKYAPGNIWDEDSQWGFEASEREGYFVMRCRAKPGGFVTFRYEHETGYNHLMIVTEAKAISEFVPGGLDRKNVLVNVIESFETLGHHQLKFYSHPEGAVTWTSSKYGDFSHYIQLSLFPKDLPKYLEGEIYYPDTLFRFDPVVSKLELYAEIAEFQLSEELEAIVSMYQTYAQRTEVEKVSLVNIRPYPIPGALKSSLDVENEFNLTFNDDLSFLTKLKGPFSLPSLDGGQRPGAILDIEGPLIAKPIVFLAKQIRKLLDNPDVFIEPRTSTDFSIYQDFLEHVSFPFEALLAVKGEGDRMGFQGKSRGPMPPEFLLEAFIRKGFERKRLRIVQDSLLVTVTGTVSGSFVVGNGIHAVTIGLGGVFQS